MAPVFRRKEVGHPDTIITAESSSWARWWLGQGSPGSLSCPWQDLGGWLEDDLGLMSLNREGLGDSQQSSVPLDGNLDVIRVVLKGLGRPEPSDPLDHI